MANGVYWTGQDGNTYMKSGGLNGVVKWAAPYQTPQQMGLQEIRDPALGAGGGGSAAPSGGGGGGGSAAPAPPPLNQGAVDNTQLTIDQIPGILQSALAAESQRSSNASSGFDSQQKQQQGQYDESTITNQHNYDSHFMDSIRAGVKGLGGLMQLLRGTGAAGGSVDQEVRDTVGGITSGDIRTGADSQKENQGQLDSSLSQFLTNLGIKRKQNDDTRVNNERSIHRESDTQLQDLYGKMAGYYGDAGRTAEANSFMTRAGSLTPQIASNSSSRVSPYDTTPVVVHAPNLTAFADPSQPNVVAAPSDGQVGSGIFSMTNRRRDKEAAQQAPAPVGA